MNIPPLEGTVKASEVPLENLVHNPHVREEEKVAELARQFEAVLLRQILASARKTVIHSGLTEEPAGSDIYQDLLNNQLADSISRGGGLGLATSLQAQLSHQLIRRSDGTLATVAPRAPGRAPSVKVHHD